MRGFIYAAIAAGSVILTIVLLKSNMKKDAVQLPLPPSKQKAHSRDPDVTKELLSGKLFGSPKPLERLPTARVELPDLTAEAGAYLAKIDGKWSAGSIVAVIDAKGARGRVSRTGEEARMRPLTVRDISGNMAVIDIGPRRFILLPHPDGLLMSGGSLAEPIKLRR
ncbi:hypothetical protein [Methylorubrum extorquens]